MKNQLIFGVLIIIITLAVGFVFMKNKSGSQSSNTATPTNVPQGEVKTMTLKDLINSGKTQQCTFDTTNPDNSRVSGTSFISGNKVRGDFTVIAEGKTTDGHMILDGDYMYNWTTQTKQGMKMQITEKMEESRDSAVNNTESYQQFLDQDTPMDYHCTEMAADTSMFIPPTDIQFVDYTEQMNMMEQMQTSPSAGESGMLENKCSVCNSLPADAKIACKQGLSCD